MARPIIQLSTKGLSLRPSEAQIESLRRAFRRRDFVLLPRLLSPDLLEAAARKVAETTFVPAEEYGVARVEHAAVPDANHFLSFALQLPDFFAFVERVTGCAPIASFSGRLLRLRPGRGHYLRWHRDNSWDAGRMVALTLNFSPKPYDGGILQLRRRGARSVTSQVANTGLGDAVLFAGSETPHRNTAVVGAREKTSFAGWFYAGRSFFAAEAAASRTTRSSS